jgi:hypothetical protein
MPPNLKSVKNKSANFHRDSAVCGRVFSSLRDLNWNASPGADIVKDNMAKGQKRSNKEVRKPRQPIAKPAVAVRGAALGGLVGKA